MKKYLTISALFVLLSSFIAVPATDPADSVSLFQTRWVLRSIHEKDKVDFIYTYAWLELDEAGKKISGNGSCNRFGGQYQSDGQSLQFGALFSTKMFCQEMQEIESAFLRNLSLVNRYVISGLKLRLYKDEQLLLEFRAV